MADSNLILPGEDLLLTISQLALGLAGFAGIVGVFRARNPDLVRQDLMGLRLILELTLAAVLLAQVPSVLFWASLSASFAIRYSSFFLALFLPTYYIREMFTMRRESRSGFPPRHPTTYKLFGFPISVFAVALICNGIWWFNVAPYAGAILVLLIAAGRQFFSLVYESLDPNKPATSARPTKRQGKS